MAKVNINQLEYCKCCETQEDDLLNGICISCERINSQDSQSEGWMDWEQELVLLEDDEEDNFIDDFDWEDSRDWGDEYIDEYIYLE